MLLFHGTTLNRFKKALEEGYLGTSNTIWDCSEPYTTYFYGEDFFKESFEGDREAIKEEGIREALASASLSLSTERRNLRRVVLVLDSEDLKKLEFEGKGEFGIDCSCKQQEKGIYQFKGKIPIELIKEIYIDREDLDYLMLFFVGLAHKQVALRNKNTYNILGYDNGLDCEVIEASLELANQLEGYFYDTLLDVNNLRLYTLKQFKEVFSN